MKNKYTCSTAKDNEITTAKDNIHNEIMQTQERCYHGQRINAITNFSGHIQSNSEPLGVHTVFFPHIAIFIRCTSHLNVIVFNQNIVITIVYLYALLIFLLWSIHSLPDTWECLVLCCFFGFLHMEAVFRHITYINGNFWYT